MSATNQTSSGNRKTKAKTASAAKRAVKSRRNPTAATGSPGPPGRPDRKRKPKSPKPPTRPYVLHAAFAAVDASTQLYQHIYDLLVADFARDGKSVESPTTTLLDSPPAGMGYDSGDDVNNFLDTFVNSRSGRQRYNLLPSSVIRYAAITPKKDVGSLDYLVSRNQQ